MDASTAARIGTTVAMTLEGFASIPRIKHHFVRITLHFFLDLSYATSGRESQKTKLDGDQVNMGRRGSGVNFRLDYQWPGLPSGKASP